MPSLYSRALALLREVHVLLNEDLRDIDLITLRKDTDLVIGQVLDADTQQRWTRVLSTVAPALMLLVSEVDTVDKFIDDQRRSIASFMVLIMILIELVVFSMLYMACSTITPTKEIPSMIMIISGFLITIMVMLCIGKYLMLVFGDRVLLYNIESNSATKMQLQYYNKNLGLQPIVRLVAAKVTGIGLDDAITDMELQLEEQTSNTVPPDASIILACAIQSTTEVPSVDTIVKLSCALHLQDISTALMQIKDEYDRYDRTTLWGRIESGVNALTRFSAKPNTFPALSAANIHDVLSSEFLPLVTLHMLDVSQLFELKKGVTKGSYISLAYHVSSVSSKSSAWRACFDDEKCALAIFSPSSDTWGQLAKFDSYQTLENFFRLNLLALNPSKHKNKIQPSVSLLLRSNNQMVFVNGEEVPTSYLTGNNGVSLISLSKMPNSAEECRQSGECTLMYDGYLWKFSKQQEEGTGLWSFFGGFTPDPTGKDVKFKVDVATLLSEIANNTTSALITLQEQRDEISSMMVTIVQKYDFVLDFDEHRKLIDALLVQKFGYDAYHNQGIQGVVRDIMRLVVEKVDLIKKSPYTKYISPAQLVQNTAQLNDTEWQRFMSSLSSVIYSTRQHRINFPPLQETLGINVRNVILAYLFPIFLVISVFSITMVYMYMDGSKKKESVMSAIAVTCGLVILVSIIEATVKKRIDTIKHKNAIIEQNGTEFVASMMQVVRELGTLRSASPSDKPIAMAQGVIRAIHNCSVNYARCNYINVNNPSNLFPTVEVVLFASIAFVFVIAAVYIMDVLNPMDSIDNIRKLSEIKKMVKNGDITTSMFSDAFSSTSSLKPITMYEDLVKRIGIIIFVFITVWFIDANSRVENEMVMDNVRECR